MRTVGCPRHRHDTSRTLHTRAVRTGIFLGLCTHALPLFLGISLSLGRSRTKTKMKLAIGDSTPSLRGCPQSRCGGSQQPIPRRPERRACCALRSCPVFAARHSATVASTAQRALTPVCVSAFSDEGRQDEAGGHDLAAGPAQGGPCVSVCTRTCKAHHVCVRDCAHAQGFVMHFIHARAHTRRACCGCPLPGRTLCYT